MTAPDPAAQPGDALTGDPARGLGWDDVEPLTRDLAEVPAVEVISRCALELLTAAAVKTGLSEDGDRWRDLDEARRLIQALAALVTGSAEHLGVHAAPLRDGLQAVQRAFREASTVPDAPGQGPGERFTGPVV